MTSTTSQLGLTCSSVSLHRNQYLCWFWANLPSCSSISQARSFCAGTASTGSCRNQPGRRWRADAHISVASADVPPSAFQTWASWGWWNWPPSGWLYLIFLLKQDYRFYGETVTLLSFWVIFSYQKKERKFSQEDAATSRKGCWGHLS